ncbi:MAG: hypothetical protein IJO54_08565 [Oscillospiraceae bacterium]|nr:hypothetical protein [Oscillospiraceae bacterium]
MEKTNGLTNDKLKIIAAAAMLVDHIGAYLLPSVTVLRIIGRIAFPIFAFMIAEGCTHTKNKKKYLFNLFLLAVLCHGAFYTFKPPGYMRIPVTFTLSVILIYILQYSTSCVYGEYAVVKKIMAAAVFFAAVIAVWYLNEMFVIDYGFMGCMTPVLVSGACWQKDMPQKYSKYDTLYRKIGLLALALFFVYSEYGGVQIYSFLAIPLLAKYNGKRENLVPKYFFYMFYPLHLAAIYAVQYFIG